MPLLTGPTQLFSADIFSSSSTQTHKLGAMGYTGDGRRFRYCKAGASALVVGDLIQSAAVIGSAHHTEMAVTATAIGATTIVATPGATGGAENLYAEGTVVVGTTPGLGYTYPVDSHLEITASTAFTINLPKDSPIQVALTTNSRVTLRHNPYKNVIQAPANTLTGAIVGVAVYPITATEYGWIQDQGVCGVLIGGTPAVGACVVSPGNTAGEVVVDPADAAVTVVGRMLVTGQDGKVMQVMLQL